MFLLVITVLCLVLYFASKFLSYKEKANLYDQCQADMEELKALKEKCHQEMQESLKAFEGELQERFLEKHRKLRKESANFKDRVLKEEEVLESKEEDLNLLIKNVKERQKVNKAELELKLETQEKDLEKKYRLLKSSLESEYFKKNKALDKKEQIQDKLYEERYKGFPWLAKAFADCIDLESKIMAQRLEQKKRPALKAAEELKKAKQEQRIAEEKYRIEHYKLLALRAKFPNIFTELDEDTEELSLDLGDDSDFLSWLKEQDYSELSKPEKWQLALDRYDKKRLSKKQLGNKYERYCGYVWESKGYQVEYKGIIDGYEDLGRDLIASKGSITEIIQCKYWSKKKLIHEKHIFQLFGTVVEYWASRLNELQQKDSYILSDIIRSLEADNIKAVFVTSTVISEKAAQIAKLLKVTVLETFDFKPYPQIKLNVASDKEKIYHLPFDQQYDRLTRKIPCDEFYVSTVFEAESRGFRRAKKWIPVNT